MQNSGIGSAALKLYLEKYPTKAHKPIRLGQMTVAKNHIKYDSAHSLERGTVSSSPVKP